MKIPKKRKLIKLPLAINSVVTYMKKTHPPAPFWICVISWRNLKWKNNLKFTLFDWERDITICAHNPPSHSENNKHGEMFEVVFCDEFESECEFD